MSEVISFEDYVLANAPHCTAEVMCIHCMKRWIGVWPANTWLKDLTCPNCNTKGYIITTGQYLEDE